MMKEIGRSRDAKAAALSNINGARLTAVQFILDYLIVGFDIAGALTLLVWPELTNERGLFKHDEPGYRDELCSLIEHTVKSIDIDADDTVTVMFSEGAQMRIALGSHIGPGERAILTGPGNYLFVF